MNNQEILVANAKKYNFYQLVNVLHKCYENDPASEDWEENYHLRFSSSPGMGFSETDVKSLICDDDKALLEITFIGLVGSQSPLPNFLLDALAIHDDENYRKDFLDFFNHRVTSIIYRVWRKYRYYQVFQANAEDKFSRQLFSFIGLGVDELRQESNINWCKMLAYIGMLAGKSRSGQVISGIINHYFDLDSSVEEWVVRFVDIPQDQKTALDKQNISLGMNTLLGDHIKDCSSKFVLSLHNLTFNRFKSFLPIGEEHHTLKEVMNFILRTQMSYDLRLGLAENEVAPLNLGKKHPSYIGWTSFMGETNQTKSVLIQMRQ